MLNGLIIGLFISVKFIFSSLKYNIFTFLALFVSISIIIILYRMVIHFRDTECEGTIKYSHAFSYIFLVYFYGSILSSFIILIYTRFIDTNLLSTMLDTLMKLYDSFKFPIDDKTYTFLQTVYKPEPYSLLNIFSSIFSGAFWGLILAGFVKKEKSIF